MTSAFYVGRTFLCGTLLAASAAAQSAEDLDAFERDAADAAASGRDAP